LEGVENFWATFNTRHKNLLKIIKATQEFSDQAWFSEEPDYMVVCPHGFSITLKDGKDITPLTHALEEAGIQWKRNFGCIPTQHSAYEFMNYTLGDFPDSEYVGNHGIHIGTHQYLSDKDVDYIIKVLQDFFNCEKNNAKISSHSI
jgi:dTDP-4-amino-4,6-dideoxygalactose transaminase